MCCSNTKLALYAVIHCDARYEIYFMMGSYQMCTPLQQLFAVLEENPCVSLNLRQTVAYAAIFCVISSI
jgi:hypothetical protein